MIIYLLIIILLLINIHSNLSIRIKNSNELLKDRKFSKPIWIRNNENLSSKIDTSGKVPQLSIDNAVSLLADGKLTSIKANMIIETILIHSNTIKIPILDKHWHKLIDASINYNFIQLTIKLYKTMIDKNIYINGYSLNKILAYICEQNHYNEAKSIFYESISNGYEASVHNFTPLLKYCPINTNIIQNNNKNNNNIIENNNIYEIFNYMISNDIKPNIVSYTSAIKSYENTGNYQNMLEII